MVSLPSGGRSRKSVTEAAWHPWHLLALHIGTRPVVATRSHRWLRLCVACSFDDCLGEGLRGFLRKIVADAARDEAVLVFAREFLGIGGGIGVWCTVGIAFKGDGG